LQEKFLNILFLSSVGTYFIQEPAQLYAIELLGSWGYFHRLPGYDKEVEVV